MCNISLGADPSSSKEDQHQPPPQLAAYNTLTNSSSPPSRHLLHHLLEPPSHPPPPAPLQPPPPPLTSSSTKPISLWQLRDPPLHYVHTSTEDPPALGHAYKNKNRSLQARRSASLSQADVLIGLRRNQSPQRAPKCFDSNLNSAAAAARYHDYYERKYEQPIRAIKVDFIAVNNKPNVSAMTPGSAGDGAHNRSRKDRFVTSSSSVDNWAVAPPIWPSTSVDMIYSDRHQQHAGVNPHQRSVSYQTPEVTHDDGQQDDIAHYQSKQHRFTLIYKI